MTAGGYTASVSRVPVRIIFVRWMIPTWAAAQVAWPRTISVRRGVRATRRLIAHELTHVLQWEVHGWMFPIKYALEFIHEGYAANRFEVEAIRAERDPVMLAWADDVIAEFR